MTAREHLNREAKVNRLIAFLDTHAEDAVSAASIKALSPAQRDAVCVLAGEKRMASELTWWLVEAHYVERESRKAVA